MRPTQPRLTIRRLMIAVAVVGLLLGLVARMRHRSAMFRQIAARHHQVWETHSPVSPDRFDPRINYHGVMAIKYEHAARYPWLPVEPDPPKPE